MRKPDAETAFAPEDAAEILESDDVNGFGDAAREKARRVSGERVYHGSLTPPDKVTHDGYAEVRLSDCDAVDTSAVDAFVGAPEDTFDGYRDAGAPVDVGVVYGDGAEAFAERLDGVHQLSEDVDVRAVTLISDGRTTAYTDLKAVAAARLCLDVSGVRVARDEVGNKLAQTALAYGANDLGFVDTEEEFDAELAAREAGFTPVDRAEAGGYGV